MSVTKTEVESPAGALPATARRRPSRRARFGVAAVLVVLAAMAIWALATRSSPRSGSAAVEAAGAAAGSPTAVDLQPVGSGFREPVEIQFLPGSNTTAIVLEKAGTARLVTFGDSSIQAQDSPVVFTVPVRTRSEMGLLGLAYHPKFTQNGLFYVNYNPEDGPMRTVVSEWKTVPAAVGNNPARQTRVLLEVAQPYPNHDGGGLAFGPDGMLYIGLGDGGAGGDPLGNGQKPSTLLGALLRIDVNAESNGRAYTIPADNPFVNRADARPEVWAYGLRNPWRFSFAPDGQLLVGDVGQNLWEEISVVPKGGNMGWSVYEASHCFNESKRCSERGFVSPVFEYSHDLGASVTGGYVYLGHDLPELKGQYIFGDYASGRIWAMPVPRAPGVRSVATQLGEWSRSISTFGRNAAGEVFLADHARGDILRLTRSKGGARGRLSW